MDYLEAAGVAAGAVLSAGAEGAVLSAGAEGAVEAGATLSVGALEAAGEVAVLEEPQPARAATSIREAATTAIVFFMGFPPKIKNIGLVTFIMFFKSC